MAARNLETEPCIVAVFRGSGNGEHMKSPGNSLTRHLNHIRFCLAGDISFGHGYEARRRFNTAIFISPDLKYLFAKNEKVANQSLRMTFQKLAAGGALPRGFHTNRRWRGPLLQPSDLPDLSLARLNDGSMFRFAVVRNPFSRVLSCYCAKFLKHTGKTPRFPRKLGFSQQASFRQFVEAICRQAPMDMDPHWRTQYHNIFCDKIEYDRFVKLENMDSELGGIIERFSGGGDILTIGRSTGASDRLVEYYDIYTERLIAEKFAQDFELFGYPTTLPETSKTARNTSNDLATPTQSPAHKAAE